MLQHGGVCSVPLLQGNRLPLLLCFLRSWLFGKGIDVGPFAQLPESLFVVHSIQLGKQCHTVAVNATEITSELIGGGVQAQMIFSLTVVATERAACLDLPPPERSRVENKPAPPGRIHDGNFFIDQAISPLRPKIRRPVVLPLWEWPSKASPPKLHHEHTWP